MSQYQTQMVPVDDTLQHLDTALNTEKMKAVFQKQLYPKHAVQIEACEIERIKYKPQLNCFVSYRLQLNKPYLQKNSEQIVCARFYQPGGSLSRFLKEVENKASKNQLLHLPELDCVTWIFPNDRKLYKLDVLTNAEFLCQQIMPAIIYPNYGPHWYIHEFEAAVIRYVPEQNCTLRVQMKIDHNLHNYQQHQLVFYGKTRYCQNGQQVYHIMQQIWSSQESRKGSINIPEPLYFDSYHRMLWQRGVPGVVLSELSAYRALFLVCVENTARQVAVLHKMELENDFCMETTSEVQELQKVRQLLYKFDAPDREKTIQLIDQLLDYFSCTESGQWAVLHGDLHLQNILVAGDRVYLIDLDNISYGDPLLDVGSFIAAILNLACVGKIPMPLAEQTIKVFLQKYTATAAAEICHTALRKYIAYALIVERVFRSFTRLKAGRMEIITDLVKQAENLLDDSFIPLWLNHNANI